MPQDIKNTDAVPATDLFSPAPCDSQNTTGAVAGALGPIAGLPAKIGSCRIEAEIGSGGMGVVLRGHDVDFGRTLAVKVVRAKKPDAGSVQRFLQEAQITARLQHPGVPPVHAVGKLEDGRPFFTMKLIQGRTLEVLLRESTDRAPRSQALLGNARREALLPPEPGNEGRLLAIFTQVCQTLAYAHSHGVIHRDLKPANIMVGAFGEVQVMDWGLAKVLGGTPETSPTAPQPAAAEPSQSDASTVLFAGSSDTGPQTQVGNVMGTLAYMAPEQARGQVHQLDERCDVFGLGAILCVILTGKPPHVGSTKTQLHRQAAKGILSDALERLDACGADPDLVQLTRACLRRDRDDRPRHAGIVAEAMAVYQAKMAERLRAAELDRAAAEIKAREERKRRKLAVGLAAAVLGLILLGVGGWWWISRQQAQRAADTARVVNEAIQETTRLGGRAEAAAPGDVIPWKEALAVVKRAEDLLASGTPTPELTETVASLRSDLATGLAKAQRAADAAELDRNMLAWLHEVREEATDLQEFGFNNAEVAEAFAGAFRKYGLDVDHLSTADAARRIRGRPIQPELVAALDMWAWKRRCVGADPPGWDRLFAIARAVEPDPWRDRLRNALARNDGPELARLSASADVAALPIAVQVLLSDALIARARIEAGPFLRRAIQEHPRDFWINFYLGLVFNYHASPPNYPEAIRYYTAALVANDRSASLYANLADALATQDSTLDEAIAAFEKSMRLNPAYFRVLVNAGHAYKKKNLPDKAMDAYRKAISLGPHKGTGVAYASLGAILQTKGRTDEAIAVLEKSLALNDKEPLAHLYLGLCFHKKGRWDDALAAYRKGLALGAEPGTSFHNIAVVLARKGQLDDAIDAAKKACDLQHEPAYALYAEHLLERGRLDDAIAAYPKALAIQPKNAKAYNNYGIALEKKNRLADAIGAFETACKLEPGFAIARKNLLVGLRRQGLLLRQQHRWEEATANYRKLLHYDPLDAQAHFDLGSSYRNQGRFADAIAAYQKSLALKPSGAATITPMIESCQGLKEWDKKLPALLRGEIKLSNPERVPLTTYCKIKKLYGLGARTYADMLRITPEFADSVATGVRYDAAVAAALASGGTGKDEPPLDDKERTHWRRQSLDWLRADLAAWSKLAGASKANHAAIQAALTKWQNDADLIPVRDPDALAKLPETERAAWRQLWQDAANLLDQLDR